MDLKKSVGAQIRAARKQRKLTQEQLAERLGVSREYLSNVERGRSGLGSLDLIAQIARKLNVDLSDILMPEDSLPAVTPETIPALSAAWSDPELRDKVLAIFDLLTQGPPEFQQALEALVSLAQQSSRATASRK